MQTLSTLSEDFILSNGRFTRKTGLDALAQIVKNRISLGLGEWYLDPTKGFDWMGLLNLKEFIPDLWIAETRRVLREETRILSILFITAEQDRQSRKVTIKFKVQTTEGLLTDEVSQ